MAYHGDEGPQSLNNTVLYINDFEGTGFAEPTYSKSFTQPIPINAVALRCSNEVDPCGVFIAVIGS